MAKKVRVAVLYGGRSGEHEISLQSAASVIRNLDPERFEIVPIAIDKQGRWLLNDVKLLQNPGKSLPVFKDAPPVVLPPNPALGGTSVVSLKPGGSGAGIDVVFPVLHGPLCEDGTVQGLLELADVPYVGCGVLASAVGMDKDVAKRLARDAGLPIVPFISLHPSAWRRDPESVREHIARELGFPVFVKPANMGSSVGVHKVKEVGALAAALNDAFRYDTKVLVERAIDAREIELAVLESPKEEELPLVSVVGEIVPHHEFYSYDAKYLDENGAGLELPAKLDAAQAAAAQRLARDIFVALECEGMARVDLFLDRRTGTFYFNEVNTIPGFTQISMYPKLWEASGIGYRELLSRLIDLALSRHARRRALLREYAP
jgi:D-alanine-D-alanine ligase